MLIARAPVRISFGGGGTDLAAYYERYGGFVLSAAITRYSYVAVRPSARGYSINSADYRLWQTFDALPPVEEPLALPKAALERFAHGLAGLDLFLASEVPPGTGLGSSSAMAVGLVSALSRVTGVELDKGSVAELASCLEIEWLGMPIGKQDQYASSFGGLNTIEFRRDRVTVEPLPVATETIRALSDRLLLFSTGHSRNSREILQQQRSDIMTKAAVAERLHRIKALAYEMHDALLASDLDGFGMLLDQAWQEKRSLSSRISSEEIDRWYRAAIEAGAVGGKITGAGGGGFLLLYCPVEKQQAVRESLAAMQLRELTFELDFDGVTLIESEHRRTSNAGPSQAQDKLREASQHVCPAESFEILR